METAAKLKSLQRVMLFVAALLLQGPVNAIPIGAGDTFTVDWYLDLDADLTATSTWTVTEYTASSIALDISITNTTVLQTGVLDQAAIVSFGFGVDPDATASMLSAGGTFTQAGAGSGGNQSFPGGFEQIDICLYQKNCSAGTQTIDNGLQAGATDTLSIQLTPDSGSFGDSIEVLVFPIQFKTKGLGTWTFDGNASIPEPAMLGLLLTGLAGIGVAGRRKRQVRI